MSEVTSSVVSFAIIDVRDCYAYGLVIGRLGGSFRVSDTRQSPIIFAHTTVVRLGRHSGVYASWDIVYGTYKPKQCTFPNNLVALGG